MQTTIGGALKSILKSEFSDDDGELVTGAEALALAIYLKGKIGDIPAAKLIADLTGEKPVENVALTCAADVSEELRSLSAEALRDMMKKKRGKKK